MPDHDIAVSVRGLSKSYTLAHNTAKHTRLTEALVDALRGLRRPAGRETFWALRDVEFDIRKGDVVGIIGRNGAGKSTLLKVLSRITEPTLGQIDIYGRVGSLLEVGTGFHPELTGRENVYMNGAILGMSRAEIARNFDAIVDFSGTEKFLDTPVKRYSSGMYVRLAFAVAAHLSSEILIVDEVLAVGDAEFQRKCLGKMKDVSSRDGRTVLFVSHNMAAVRQLCNTGIILKSGRMAFSGDASECIQYYMDEGTESAGPILAHIEAVDADIEVSTVTVNGLDNDQVEVSPEMRRLTVAISGELMRSRRMEIEIKLTDLADVTLGYFSPGHYRGYTDTLPSGPFNIVRTVELPERMNKGEYYLHLYLTEPDVKVLAQFPRAIRLTAEGTPTKTGRALEYSGGAGLLSLAEGAESEIPFRPVDGSHHPVSVNQLA